MLGWRGPITYRQFLVYEQYEADQMQYPSRTDHYLMAIRLDMRNLTAKVQSTDLEKMRLVPKKGGRRSKPVSKELATAWAKSRWLRMMTAPVEERKG